MKEIQKANVYTIEISATGKHARTRTVFVTGNTLNEYAAKKNAEAMGLAVQILKAEASICDEDPNAAMEALLDTAAVKILGDDAKVSGATVDPMKARMNELEHGLREIKRSSADLMTMMERLAGIVEKSQRPVLRAGIEPHISATVGSTSRLETSEYEPPPAHEDVADRVLQATGKQTGPRDQRRGRNEQRGEIDSSLMGVTGTSPKSEMFYVDGAGEIEKLALPTVGDTLRSNAWRSDIPDPNS